MACLIVILIGLIQGVAEFLPISSSGHLVVLYDIFNITDSTILLSILLHLATLFAVVIVYFKDIITLIKNPFCKTNKLLVTATIPTVIIVLIFEGLIGSAFEGDFVIIGFLITAIVLVISEYISSKKQKGNVSDILNLNISYKNACIIGVAQGIACVPGISRSGSTIATALCLGENKEDATKFSFLMSIPIIIASFLYELLKIDKATFDFSVIEIFVGFLVAFIVGIISIRFMIKFVKKQKLYVFSIYLVVLVIILLVNKYVVAIW